MTDLQYVNLIATVVIRWCFPVTLVAKTED